MKKTRTAHLWIGLISSIFIFMESLTGLIMNEPWLIGQSQLEERGNFQPGQIPANLNQQGTTSASSSQSGTTQSQANDQSQATAQPNTNGQNNNGTNGQFPGAGGAYGRGGFKGEGAGTQSVMGIVRGLHEGRIGTTDIKWLIDLIAIAMMLLTGTGIYLSIKILGADKKRKKTKVERTVV
ncbi:PepSY-associated TM helix domain-containing protein [Neobacillus sp. OS1-32]|uniref:PepSY-associated TM helix domain-containing protein n=1 Tax=Neobacillus sp. OS1-32 TaxID=3070682 RepID=UPI0027E0E18B|nr:PepSY-associated TM helix domain-containing protein [Neobacillus sp. OS1-32]WML28872.1 PepSY-associated TM helix domain-containing protein [Neobacillus sp. OS1-32]